MRDKKLQIYSLSLKVNLLELWWIKSHMVKWKWKLLSVNSLSNLLFFSCEVIEIWSFLWTVNDLQLQ